MKKGFLSGDSASKPNSQGIGAEDSGSGSKDAPSDKFAAMEIEDAEDKAAGAPLNKKAAGSKQQAPEPRMNVEASAARYHLGPARRSPVACLVLGMAGSGKSTLMQRIGVYIHEKQIPSYVINLDPAVSKLSYGCNIDIRDTVNYKEVMKQYKLGPNGGIMTSLNLFATKFDQVMDLMEKKADTLQNVFIDTPGQIEIFTWSASGTIISDMLAYSFPTVVLYVVDTPRTASPVTFMSNMLYACSIMYKLQLPFILVFNKTDIVQSAFATKWMTDYDAFQAAVQEEKAYAGTLSASMGLVLEEFYQNIVTASVSAVTGDGMESLFEKIGEAGEEYHKTYRPRMEERAKSKAERDAKLAAKRVNKLREQMKATGGLDVAVQGRGEGKTEEEEEEEAAEERARWGGLGGGGLKAFEPDSDESLEDGEDDIEAAKLARQSPMDQMMDQMQARGGGAGMSGTEDLGALNEILASVNEGKVSVD